jgi:hypothetical protein
LRTAEKRENNSLELSPRREGVFFFRPELREACRDGEESFSGAKSAGVIKECLGAELVDLFFSEEAPCFRLSPSKPRTRNKIVVNYFGEVAMITYSCGWHKPDWFFAPVQNVWSKNQKTPEILGVK